MRSCSENGRRMQDAQAASASRGFPDGDAEWQEQAVEVDRLGVKGGRGMKPQNRWSVLIGLLLMVGLISVAPAQQPRYGGTLRVAQESDNNSKKPFDDVRVRQALGGYGIDRHAIAKIAMLGLGKALLNNED
jgi:ABC-type transport system substrate-binding protein